MNDTSEALAVQLAVVAAQQAAAREQLTAQEERLRMVETAVVSLSALPQIVKDLEERQRADERWRHALPVAVVAAALAAVGTIITGAAALIDKIG